MLSGKHQDTRERPPFRGPLLLRLGPLLLLLLLLLLFASLLQLPPPLCSHLLLLWLLLEWRVRVHGAV
jgi:hypothetical protein